MPLEPNAMLGPYQIVGLLGEGGMGAVYRARDTRLGREVAVKVLTNVAFNDRERLLRFEQEARATGMLNHPNLLTIYDVGHDESSNPYLVSELLEGETLRARLDRGALSPRKATDAAHQMALGLAAAHEKGVVHRDLKPDNIFLTRDGRLKILDFGIAKLTSAKADGPTFEMAATEPGMVMGTVGYMSPEQVRGEAVDHRSDIFSLGAIFYEMLTGQRAFRRGSSIETLSAILQDEPPELSEIVQNVPPPLDRLLRRCLEKDREMRFQSARDLSFSLETLSSMTGSQTMPPMGRTGAVRPTPAPQSTAAPLPVRTPTTARPLTKPKRRISPLLLGLLYLVSIGGAAYGGWIWAHRITGVTSEPTFDRVTFRRGEVRSARFTADGETIVYSAAWDGKAPETFVTARHASEARPLGIEDSEVLAVSKSTELAILLHRDRITNVGTLARVPIAGGMPRSVAEDVMQADWSPDGENLAILRVSGDKMRVEYPVGRVRYETLHQVRDVRVSPDGKKVAILEPAKGAFDVAIIEDGQPVTIARGWGRGATGLAWTRDGKEIWVSGTSNSAPPSLWAVNVETGDVRLVSRLTGSVRLFDLSPRGEALLSNGMWRAALVWKRPESEAAVQAAASLAATAPPWAATATAEPAGTEHDASWYDWSVLADLSPDGRTILFSETREGGGEKSAVFLRRMDEPSPVRLADGIGDALSPDGKWALVHQGTKLVLVPTGPGEPRELKIDGAFDNGAAFFPDSRRVVVGGVVGKGSYRLHVVDTLDETAKPLSPENVWSTGLRAFAVSPDGKTVAGMNAESIVLYPVGGGEPRPLAGVEKGEIPIQWSADGASILVYHPTGIPARIWRVDVTTGTRELWREFRPADPAGVYKIAPALVTPDAHAWAYNAMRVLSDLYVAEGVR